MVASVLGEKYGTAIARRAAYSDWRPSSRCFWSDFMPVIGAGWYVHLSAMRRRWQRPHIGVTWSQLSFDFRQGSHDGRCVRCQWMSSTTRSTPYFAITPKGRGLRCFHRKTTENIVTGRAIMDQDLGYISEPRKQHREGFVNVERRRGSPSGSIPKNFAEKDAPPLTRGRDQAFP